MEKRSAYIAHPLLRENAVEKREYQENILKTAERKNTLVVLPTGIGKTIIAVLLAARRLEQFPEEKVLVLAPSRPLVMQHRSTFAAAMSVPESELIAITGTVKPEKRISLYETGRIIFSTPQTVENDLKEGRLSLKSFCLLVVDEAHRSVGNYSYTFVARKYMTQAEHALILALTASPGSEEERIREICENLFIRAVEIRTEEDEDVREYIKPVKIEIVKIPLSPELEKIRERLKEALKERKEKLREYGFKFQTKKDLLDLQAQIGKRIDSGNSSLFPVLVLVAEALKIWHALELLETESVTALREYMERLFKDRRKKLLRDERIKSAYFDLLGMRETHPKIEKLKEIVREELKRCERILVFSHYRDNILRLYRELKSVPACKPCYLIGQAGEMGQSQREQIETVKRFEAGEFNCLIGSPVSEEGLHIPSVDVGIFYDAVPSEIRLIQRRGRIGRVKFGKVIFLLLRNSRDEAYFYTALRKERSMKRILKRLKETGVGRKITLFDF